MLANGYIPVDVVSASTKYRLYSTRSDIINIQFLRLSECVLSLAHIELYIMVVNSDKAQMV